MQWRRLVAAAGATAVVLPLLVATAHAEGRVRVADALWAGVRAPVLAYHELMPAGQITGALRQNPAVMAVRTFAAQMDELAADGYHPVRLSAFAGGGPLPRRAVLITIDDGYASTYRYAYPILARHGFPATIFILTDLVGKPGYLTWAQIRAMRGLIDVGGHSGDLEYRIHHVPALEVLPRARVLADLRRCRQAIAAHVGVAPDAFAYPFGSATAKVAAMVRQAGFTIAFAGQHHPPAGVPARLAVPRFPVSPGISRLEFRLFALGERPGPSGWVHLVGQTFAHGWTRVSARF